MIISFGRLNLWLVPDPSRGRRGPDVFCAIRRRKAFAVSAFGYRLAVFFV